MNNIIKFATKEQKTIAKHWDKLFDVEEQISKLDHEIILARRERKPLKVKVLREHKRTLEIEYDKLNLALNGAKEFWAF